MIVKFFNRANFIMVYVKNFPKLSPSEKIVSQKVWAYFGKISGHFMFRYCIILHNIKLWRTH